MEPLVAWMVVLQTSGDLIGRPFLYQPRADRGIQFGAAQLADELTVLTATCAVCGGVATRSQRLIDGRPARRDSPTVQIGGRELYEPRCERDHAVDP